LKNGAEEFHAFCGELVGKDFFLKKDFF